MGTAAQTPEPKPETARSDRERVDYLIEFFKLAKEELLLRFKYRRALASIVSTAKLWSPLVAK